MASTSGKCAILIGGGGRESAIAVALTVPPESPLTRAIDTLYIIPGNGGTEGVRNGVRCVNVSEASLLASHASGVSVNDAIVAFAVAKAASLVVVGPEVPLAAGLADACAAAGVPCFGPTAAAARIESSKAWSKAFMVRHGIPTPRHASYTAHELSSALEHIRGCAAPPVIKASGLAAGKGVILPATTAAAEAACVDMFKSYDTLVIEERHAGVEVSLLAFCDGERVQVMPPAQDFKRAFDMNSGPNTGGMGAIAPSTALTRAQLESCAALLTRTVAALREEGLPFVGVLYAGIMLSASAGPLVLEFNARFGDPETQVLLPLLRTPLLDVLQSCTEGRLQHVLWHTDRVAAAVVLASSGYPGKFVSGHPIQFKSTPPPGGMLLHAGSSRNEAGEVVTSGGRVLVGVGVGSSLSRALQVAYETTSTASFKGGWSRRDIGFRYNTPDGPLRVGVLASTRGTDLKAILASIACGDLNRVTISLVIASKSDAGVIQLAGDAGIPCVVIPSAGTTRSAWEAAALAALDEAQVQVVACIGFMRILSPDFIARYACRILNVHPSLLPLHAGGMDTSVHDSVIAAGEKTSGCTVHVVDEVVDGGAMLVQLACPVLPDDTAATLKERVQALEGIAYVHALKLYSEDAGVPLLDLCTRTGGDWSRITPLLELHANDTRRTRVTASPTAPLTYAAAGVDIDAGDELVQVIKPACKSTARPGADAELGGFGAMFDLKAAGYVDPLLVSSTDGVGTKLRVAAIANVHSTVGIDLVAMSVNDLIVQGAEPLLFLDYYACGVLQVPIAADVIRGIAEGCRQAGCALAGGETAEMPSMYHGGDYDLAGFAVGAVERTRVLPNMPGQVDGDVVLGIASSGVHSNGFSLVRRIVDAYKLDWTGAPPFASTHARLCDELLTPTKIYVRCLMPSIKAGDIKAMAHITGGGLPDNVPRVIRDDLQVVINVAAWDMPPVFKWMATHGTGVAPKEMLRTFNCGIGMVVITSAQAAERVAASIAATGERVYTIGRVRARTEATKDDPCVVVENADTAFAPAAARA